jgi:hypothetical protein
MCRADIIKRISVYIKLNQAAFSCRLTYANSRRKDPVAAPGAEKAKQAQPANELITMDASKAFPSVGLKNLVAKKDP